MKLSIKLKKIKKPLAIESPKNVCAKLIFGKRSANKKNGI
jgi:hypothetical protein